MKVAAMRDRADWPPRLLLFLSADLGESAVEASALVEAVVTHEADCAIAVPPAVSPAVGRSLAENMARKGIRRATGWEPQGPLAEQRCLTREVLNAVMPFASGYGLEPAMTIDLLVAGFTVMEVPCAFTHLGSDHTIGELNRNARYADAWWAIQQRHLRGVRLSPEVRKASGRTQRAGRPYPSMAPTPQ